MPMTFQLCKEPTVTVEPIAPVVQSSVKSVAPKWDPSMPVEPRYKVKVSLQNFSLNTTQKAFIENLYESGQEIRLDYGATSESQARAETWLKDNTLSVELLNQLESRWNICWSNEWHKGGESRKRTRYQCNCGYNSKARQQKSKKALAKDWERHAPYDFTGCCAHVDITYYLGSGDQNRVERVIGYITHNEECKLQRMKRMPPIPLHEHVYEVALLQLDQGCSVSTIQQENMQRFEQKLYRGQLTWDSKTANVRYELLPGDFSRLHRRYYWTQGIDVETAPERNVHNWIDRKSPEYNTALAEAVFHYSARATEKERFEICISTPEMKEAGWKYVHKKQLILDGTFGVCTSRLLLWIAMGVDDNGHGLPVAMFLFSAPTGTKATHAGYDTKIIAKLLKTWRDSMTRDDGELFKPLVAITDTDFKERGALVQNWPQIKLLLCKFHLKQCWSNKRDTLLTKKNEDYFQNHSMTRLIEFEKRMLQTTEYSYALADLAAERNVFTAIAEDAQSKDSGNGGLLFLQYFESTWLSRDLWESWSQKGRNDAASLLQVDIEGVLPTTNHLESFNRVLKRKHLVQWQRGGRRLRFDILIHRLVQQILPNIYGQHRLLNSFYTWKSERFQEAAGGVIIPSQSPRKRATQNLPPLAFYMADSKRDGLAQDFVKLNRVVSIPSGRKYELWGVCAATGADMRDPNHPRYWMSVHPSGSATCTCMDWLTRGGACKHLRAFRLRIDRWSREGLLQLKYHFPRSRDEALHIDTQNRNWYGDNFCNAITAPLQNTNVLEPLTAPPKTFSVSKTFDPLPPHNSTIAAPSLEQEAEWEEQINSLESSADVDPDSSSDMKTYWTNCRAIEIQIQQRFHQYISQTLPMLHGIEILLGDSTPALTTQNLDEFIETLDLLSARLKAARFSSSVQNNELTVSIPTLIVPPPQNNGLTSIPTPIVAKVKPVKSSKPKDLIQGKRLLPPSPEAKQKRHKSYSTI